MTRLSRPHVFGVSLVLLMVVWPMVYHNEYVLNVMVIAGLYSLVTVGFSLLLGQAGQVSLGQATFFGVGAYTSALLTTRAGAPPLLALAVGTLAAGVVAYIIGRPILRLKGIMLVLVTLAMGEIFYVFLREARTITGGFAGVGGIPYLNFGSVVLDSFLRQYYATWALVFLVVVFSRRAIRSRAGRAMRAVAIDESTASTLGIQAVHWKVVAFVASALFAGAAGGLYAFVMSAVNPEDFGFMFSMTVLIMVMVGGINSLFGAVAGAVLMTWLVRSFSGFQQYGGSVYAVVLVLIVIFLPLGLAGGIRRDQMEWLRRTFRLQRVRHPSSPKTEPGLPAGAGVLAGHVAIPMIARRERDGTHFRVGTDDGAPLLKLEGVSVSFGGLQALGDVSISVREGAIASLIGPNGAGKTTLFNVISALQRPKAGRLWFAGREITGQTACDIARLGMARTFQGLHVFANMTVLENVMTGRHRHEATGFVAAGFGLPGAVREEKESRRRSLEVLAMMGLEDLAESPVGSLPYGQQRLVEIARALATEPRLLMLDEPAAGLNATERVHLMERVARIRDSGVTVLLVEHDMELVMGISDTVCVLDHGRLIATGPPEEVQLHPGVIEAYLGVGGQEREAAPPAPVRAGGTAGGTHPPAEPLLKVEGISTYYGSICAVRDVSFEVMPGEILVALGANGAGKTTLLRTISGALRARSGRVFCSGRDVTGLSPSRIVRHGIGHVPEGRHVFPTISVHDNLRLGAYLQRNRAEIDEDFEAVYELFPVLFERRQQIAGTLSGGEQQMLAIGRALMGRPRLLMIDEPSMGLAPLIVEQIFDTLGKLNRQDLTLLIVEQNAHMALSIAHRALVLETGRMALEGTAEQLRSDARVQDLYLGKKRSPDKDVDLATVSGLGGFDGDS